MTAYHVAQAAHPRGHILHDFLEARVLVGPLAGENRGKRMVKVG